MACPCTTTTTTTTSNCTPCSTECPDQVNGQCVVYDGSGLPNLGIDANTDINEIFEAIDNIITRDIVTIKVTIPSASIKAGLFSSPYTILNSPGSGKFVQILDVSARMSGTLSTAYTVAGGDLIIKATGATNPIRQMSDVVLTGTDDTIISDMRFANDSTRSGKVNTAIQLSHSSANPTLGTGDLNLYISYVVITQ